MSEKEEKSKHDSCVDKLASLFEKQGYKVITEGKIPKRRRKEWREPDIFVLKGLTLEKIVEVTITDSYEGSQPNSVLNKCKKIKEYYNPPEIIVFEPTRYTDKHYPRTLKQFRSYRNHHQHLHKKWKKQGLNVIFWNEDDLSEKEQKREGVES